MEPTETNPPIPEAIEPSPSSLAPLEADSAGPDAAAPPRPDSGSVAAPGKDPQPYVAQRPLLSAHELRRLEADYEQLLQELTARLSLYFRTECDLNLESLQTCTCRQWTGGLLQPTHLTLFKVEPWRGIGVLEISPALGLAMTDRLMGGPGQAVAASRELSEIEIALLDQVAQFVTEAWCGQWQRWQDLKPVLLGHENDPRYLQTSPPDSTMLVAAVNARMGECVGQLQLALPFATLDILIQKLRAELKPATEEAPDRALATSPPWNAAFDDLALLITAELPAWSVPARAIPQLKVGELVELPGPAVNRVHLRLGGLPRFIGRLGTRDEHWAVEVTEVLKP